MPGKDLEKERADHAARRGTTSTAATTTGTLTMTIRHSLTLPPQGALLPFLMELGSANNQRMSSMEAQMREEHREDERR